ncbi:ETV3 protein, partial [Zosterops hypoxanthus]|nr:ETV3 protein [Zosterops hypoxanthus]
SGVVPQSAPPVPTASSRFHFPPLDPHSPTEDSQPRFPPGSLLQPHPEALGEADRKAEPADADENAGDWRRELLAPSHPSASAASSGAPKRKPDVVLPLFSRPGIFPEHPHSPFAVSPLPGRPGVLNVPISPALSLTPTLFSYSPSPGLSPFAGSSCFSFNPEEMKHYLHSQACSVFNYHLSPRTFPRYPLVVPPLQCQVPLEEQPQFPIKLQPPPAGRKNRERLESPEGGGGGGGGAAGGNLNPPRVKVEKEEEEKAEKREEEDDEEEEEEEKRAVFARPAAPPAWIPIPAPHPGSSSEENVEKAPRDPSGDGGAQERREDALMPPKLRLKRRWNGDSRQELPEEPRHNGVWILPKAVAAASDT